MCCPVSHHVHVARRGLFFVQEIGPATRRPPFGGDRNPSRAEYESRARTHSDACLRNGLVIIERYRKVLFARQMLKLA